MIEAIASFIGSCAVFGYLTLFLWSSVKGRLNRTVFWGSGLAIVLILGAGTSVIAGAVIGTVVMAFFIWFPPAGAVAFNKYD